MKCENVQVTQDILNHLDAIDQAANGLLARSNDSRLGRKMMEIGQKSKNCDDYTAQIYSFLLQVQADLNQLDKTLTLEK